MDTRQKRSFSRLITVTLSLLLGGTFTVSAALLTPLTVETYIEVELLVLEKRIEESRVRLAYRQGRRASATTGQTQQIDAVYRAFNTNFLEHARYGDKHRALVEAWLAEHPAEQRQWDVRQGQLEALNNAIEQIGE